MVSGMISERQNEILNILKEREFVIVQDLAEELFVSEITIRRDLKDLEEKNKIVRIRGGAKLVDDDPLYLNQRYEIHSQINLEEKKAIGQFAASLVLHGETIIIDSGSTTVQLARALYGKRGITAVVTAVNIAEELENREGITTILSGGTYRAKTACLSNPFFDTMFQMIYANKVFLGVTEFNFDSGFSVNDFLEYGNKKEILKSGKEIYFLADSSKLNKKDGKASIRLCELKKEYHIITDGGIQPEVKDRLEDMCQLHIAQLGKN